MLLVPIWPVYDCVSLSTTHAREIHAKMVRMAAKIVGHKKSSRPTITQEQEAIAFPGASSFVFGDHEGEDRAESGGARGSSLLLGSFDSTGVMPKKVLHAVNNQHGEKKKKNKETPSEIGKGGSTSDVWLHEHGKLEKSCVSSPMQQR